jgi:hypothetical protein
MVASMLTISAFISTGMDFTPVDENDEEGAGARAGVAPGRERGGKVTATSGKKRQGDGEQLLELVSVEAAATSSTGGTHQAGEHQAGEVEGKCEAGSGGDSGSVAGVSTAAVTTSTSVAPSKEAEEAQDMDSNGEEEEAKGFPGGVVNNRAHVASRLLVVLALPEVTLTFLLFLLMGASMAVTDTFLFLWLDELGASRLLMGLALCVTCLSEVLVFRHEARIKQALSTSWCVALILLCYGLRQTFYAALPRFSSPWVVLPAQLLHGITFGLYWSVGEDT